MPYTIHEGSNKAPPVEGLLRSMPSSTISVSSSSRICLGLMLCVCQLGCSRGPQYYVAKGNRLYSEGKYPEAVLNYRNGIKKDANFAEAHYRLGLAELKQGNGRGAYDEFQRAVALAPNREDIRVELANLVLMSYSADPGKPKVLYNQIRDTAEYLLNKDANSFQGLRLRGDVLSIDGRFDEAIVVFRKADSVRPLEPQVILPMVQVLFRLNRAIEAEALAQKFIRGHKDFGPGYDVLLNHYIQTKRIPEAEALLKSKVANMPKEANAFLQLALFYLQLPSEPAMLQALQGILNNPKDFPQGHQIVGDFYAKNGKWDEAVREYTDGLQADKKVSASYQKRIAKALIAKGKRDEAIEELDQVIKSNAEDWDSRVARAILLRESSDPKKLEFAVSELNAVLAKNPNDEVARHNLGLAYLAKGDSRSAHAQLAESAKLNREYLPPRLLLAQMAQKERLYTETIRFADEVLAVDPGNADGKFWRAAGLIGNKSYNQARSLLSAVLKEQPDSINANLHLAVLDTIEKKYKDAETRYLHIYKPGQRDLRPLEGLIQLYGEQQQVEKSLKLLEAELKQAPNSRPVRLLLAATTARIGKLDLAVQQYQWLQSDDPKSAVADASLGDVYRAKGDINSALASYQRAREISPNDPKIIAMIAYLESTSGQATEAIADLRRQLALDPENVIAMNNLAFSLAEMGSDLDQALALAEKAQRKAPSNPGIADTLGWVYTKKGLNDSAVQVFNGLVKKYPDQSAFRYHLGIALLQQGKLDEARVALTLSLANKPPKQMADKIKDILAKIG
jgi:tetratricopeptide (TPR) repeat protein